MTLSWLVSWSFWSPDLCLPSGPVDDGTQGDQRLAARGVLPLRGPDLRQASLHAALPRRRATQHQEHFLRPRGGEWPLALLLRLQVHQVTSYLNVSVPLAPRQKPTMFDVSREMGSSVALYSRKVLIQTKATDILPKWLRFLRGSDLTKALPPSHLVHSVHDFTVQELSSDCLCAGVVDSEDIPLNLSRELLQESALIRYWHLFYKLFDVGRWMDKWIDTMKESLFSI